MNIYIILLIKLIVVLSATMYFHYKLKSNINDNYRVVNLCKILIVFILHSMLGFVVLKPFSSDLLWYFWASKIYNMFLVFFFYFAVAKYTPILKEYRNIFSFPSVKLKLNIHIAVILFFIYCAISLYTSINISPDKLMQDNMDTWNVISVIPYVSIPLYIMIGFLYVFVEELVFRYFAINALRSYIGNRMLIFITAILWMFMHTQISLYLLIVGLFLGYIFVNTNNIFICIFLHFLSNITVQTGVIYLYLQNYSSYVFSSIYFVVIILISFIVVYSLLILASRLQKKEIST
jgi:membrane protease YdiL (CAAX protease family)